jgi:hypothetical protein
MHVRDNATYRPSRIAICSGEGAQADKWSDHKSASSGRSERCEKNPERGANVSARARSVRFAAIDIKHMARDE